MEKQIVDINLAFVKQYLRIEQDFLEDDVELELYMIVAKEYLKKRCGLSDEELSQSFILTIPYLMLINDFYSNKSTQVQSNLKVNFILDRFINMERKTF